MSLAMTPDEREAFLADVHIGVLGAARPDGPPSLTPIWYRYAEGVVEMATMAASAKVALLRAAGRASLCVQREEAPPAYVTVEGDVTIGPLPPAVVEDIASRYLGAEGGRQFAETTEDDTLLTLRIDSWRASDFGKLGG